MLACAPNLVTARTACLVDEGVPFPRCGHVFPLSCRFIVHAIFNRESF
jgi:hypothetical protein